MEQSLWQNNKDEGKPRFLRRWDVIARERSDEAISYIYARDCHALQARNDSAEGRIKLPFGSNRILLGSQIRRPCSLAKISNVSQKSSLFLRMKEASLFAKISNACQKSSALPLHQINYGKRDKNKIIY